MATRTSYSRRTITGGRKTVTYINASGRNVGLSQGRRQLTISAGLQATGYGAIVARRAAGSARFKGSPVGGGTTHRVVNVRRKSGNGRVSVSTVARAKGTSVRGARSQRRAYIAANSTGRSRYGNYRRTLSASNSGKIRTRKGGGGKRKPPKLSSAQRAAIARRRSRDSRGKFR